MWIKGSLSPSDGDVTYCSHESKYNVACLQIHRKATEDLCYATAIIIKLNYLDIKEIGALPSLLLHCLQ